MGGFGSGRHAQGGKQTTSEYLALDVRCLQRKRMLTPGCAFSWSWSRGGEVFASIQVRTEADRLILNYRHRSPREEWQTENYPVNLDWTPCTFGGQRAWFICPTAGCGKRVAILYCGGLFMCRRCHQLTYRCQRENADDRASRRADRIRHKLGWEPGILNPNGGKPKGMHWSTFNRLCNQHKVFVNVSYMYAMQRFGVSMDELDQISNG